MKSRRKFLKGIASGLILVGGQAFLAGRAEAQAKAPAKGAAGAGGAKGAAGAPGVAVAAGGPAGAAAAGGPVAAAAGGPVAAAAGGPVAAGGGGGGGGGGGTVEYLGGSYTIPTGAEEMIVVALLGYGIYRIRNRRTGGAIAGGAAAAVAV